MEKYLTIEELADYLKLAVQTIRRWVQNDKIPYHKIRKVIRFRVSEIEQWIENGGGYTFATEEEEEDEYQYQGHLFEDDEISLEELAELEAAEEDEEDYE